MGACVDRLKAVGVVVIAAGFLAACGESTPRASDKIKRGEYLVAVGACGDCHTPGAMLGQPDMSKVYGGGNVGFEIPQVGIFFPPNLTPDNDTGLGKWSEEEISEAIRHGVRPDNRQLAPVMPYHWYSKLTDDDVSAMAAYLKSLTPLSNKVPGPFGPTETPTGPYQTVAFPKAPSVAPAAEPAPTTPAVDPAVPAPSTP